MPSRRLLLAGAAVLAGSVLVPSTAAPASPGAPAQEGGYDGHLEQVNAWGLEALNLPAAHETTRGEGVTVAVIDTGMSNHPFFEDKDVLPGHSTYSPDEEDAWYDIHPDDPAAPAPGSGPEVADKRGHGTAVASQVLLAAPEATILPVRTGTGVADGFTNLWLDGGPEIEAIRWAVDNGADVIVMAWGVWGEPSEEAYMAMQYAIDNDVVLLTGAGNEPEATTTESFPTFMRGVVTVSGLGEDGEAWESTSTGPEVDVAAPADWSLRIPMPQSHPHMAGADDHPGPGGLYEEAGGTSLAVGWIGGVVGLIRAAHPDLDANGVIQRLLRTTADRGDPGPDHVFGHGVPDAAAALGAEVDTVETNPLGYPLGVPGASGMAASGEPAPGTNATAQGGADSTDSGGSDLVPLAGVAALAAALAGGAWFLLSKRKESAGPLHGSPGPSPPRTAVLVTVAVALVVAAGAYVGADAVVDTSEPADAAVDAGEPADAGSVGQTAADGSAPAVAAQAWQDAYTAGDVEAFRSAACQNPWYRVAINVEKLEDANFVRPGFAILTEEHDETDGDWQGENYWLLRQSDGKAWVGAGNVTLDAEGNPNIDQATPTYQIALVAEGGEWKVCDFWYTNRGGEWQDLPEFTQRFPRGVDTTSGPTTSQEVGR